MRRLAIAAALVLALVPLPARPAVAAACGATGTPTTTVYLPNITKTLGGTAGWVTPFIVQNVGTAATTLEVSFYRFSDGGLVTCRSVPGLLAGTSFADVPNNDTDLPDDSQFSVVVRSFGSQVVSVVNEHQGSGDRAEALSYVGLSQGATSVALPYVAKAVGGWTTTMVIQDLGTADAVVTASFTSADGSRTATLTRTVAPGRAQFIDPRVETALATGTEYAVLLTSAQPVAAIVNGHNDAPGVAHPMGFSYNGAPSASLRQVYLPYVARNTDGVGRQTRIVVQNAGSSDAAPSLSFQKLGGGPAVTVSAPVPVRPGRAWSFDPRFAADGVTACPPAGSAGCVAEGEHSLVVSGGLFATVAIVTSDATAMGYTGVIPAASRVYLPNVTRTLGGPSGWTTPILLQSAGATSATLRWYRFADGSLAVTQTLAGLSAGASLRVDPRGVSGLADSTQYAVVVDAPGPIAAVVTELSLSGGDGAMIYEGFASAATATPVATAVALTPATATLAPGAAQVFTATVTDQFGAPMAGAAVTWSAVPGTLGVLAASGASATFTAGQTAGTGAVIASAGAVTVTATVTVTAPGTVVLGGITFQRTATAHADVFAEATISAADQQTIVGLVEPAVTYLQTDFARSFTARPQIYAFTTMADLQAAWRSVLGGTGAAPSSVSGVYIGGSTKIALNWDAMKQAQPYRSVRHELTHMLEHQLAGPGTIPTWFDEGLARFEDLSEPGGLYRTMESRYYTGSAALTGTLLNVVSLTTDQFYALSSLSETYAYYESAETIRLLRTDLTQAGLVRILELIGQGQTFTVAYAAVALRSFDTFTAGRVTRLRALAPAAGIASATDTYRGNGMTYVVYGLTPSAAVTVTLGGAASGQGSGTTDAFGVYESYLASSWPTGTYTLTATSGTTTLTTTAAKTSVFASIDLGEPGGPATWTWLAPPLDERE